MTLRSPQSVLLLAKLGAARSLRERHHQRGEGLLSFLLFLFIVVVVVGALYGMRSTANSQVKEQVFISDANSLAMIVKNNRDTSGYTNVKLDKLQSTKQLPNNMAGYNGGDLLHAYGGKASLATTQSTFTWTFAGVPANACPAVRNKLNLSNPYATINNCAGDNPTDLVITEH